MNAMQVIGVGVLSGYICKAIGHLHCPVQLQHLEPPPSQLVVPVERVLPPLCLLHAHCYLQSRMVWQLPYDIHGPLSGKQLDALDAVEAARQLSLQLQLCLLLKGPVGLGKSARLGLILPCSQQQSPVPAQHVLPGACCNVLVAATAGADAQAVQAIQVDHVHSGPRQVRELMRLAVGLIAGHQHTADAGIQGTPDTLLAKDIQHIASLHAH